MPAFEQRSTINVAVCVVRSADGLVLLAERTSRQVAAGFWELPGGKIEPGETAEQAATRELQEETGLSPIGLTAWITYEHSFPSKRLRLHFFRMQGWVGTPLGREGQRLAWVDPSAPHVGPLLPSNERALFAMGLPPSYVIADFNAQSSPDCFLAGLHEALSDGATLIRVRTSATSPGQTASLLARVAALAGAFPKASILAASVMDARRAGLAGVHSCTRELRRLTARPSTKIWAASCHHETDVNRAASLGADFIVLSPIMPDPDRPLQRPIGWDRLRSCAAASQVGVYAQGGLTKSDAQAVQQAGGAGLVVACAAAHQSREDGRCARVVPHRVEMRV